MAAGGGSILTQRLQAGSDSDVERAARLLQAGRLVAMPTETVYGLAANALDPAAIEGIFVAKGRPHWDPLIVHISDDAMRERVVREVTPVAQNLMDSFWPGPLTILLPRHPALPSSVTAGRDLVGVRMPAHAAALALIRASGVPLAAPSANRFGHISPTTAEHVLADLDGRIDAVLDAGPCSIGMESTVFDPAEGIIYRQGGVSADDLSRVTAHSVRSYEAPETASGMVEPGSLPSPGVGIRHYAPRARVLLVETPHELQSAVDGVDPTETGVMLPNDWQLPGFRGSIYRWSAWNDQAALARTLYAGLRALDQAGINVIVCPRPEGQDCLCVALRDRLGKAARQ